MRVVYKKPIVEMISEAIHEAKKINREIDVIYLDHQEIVRFRSETRGNHLFPFKTEWDLKRQCFWLCGVKIMEETS
jgi:hypothetical protein